MGRRWGVGRGRRGWESRVREVLRRAREGAIVIGEGGRFLGRMVWD